MTKRLLSVLLIVCCLSVEPPLGVAQPAIVGVSLNMGSIDNAQPRVADLPQHALFPRLEVSSMIAQIHSTGAYVGASVSFGRWNDGVTSKDFTWTDSPSLYAYVGTVLGARLTVDSGNSATPMRLWAGYSRHWKSGEVIVKGAYFNESETVEDNHGTLDIGARLSFPVFPSVLLGLEVERLFRSVKPSERVNRSTRLFYYGIVATYLL